MNTLPLSHRSFIWLLIIVFLIAVRPLAAQVPKIEDEPNSDQPMVALDTGGHTHAVYKLMVSGYSPQLISCGLDKTIRFWNLDTGEPTRVLRPPMARGAHGYLFSAALSPDSKLLAVGTYRALTPLLDMRIHLIDVSSGEMIRSLKGHIYTIYDLAFSADGERLASASHDGTVRIWHVATGETLHVLKGHSAPVHAVAWHPNGKLLLSGSMDKTARLWSTISGTATAVLREAKGEVMTVGWRPDGNVVAVASYDRTIRLYDTAGKLIYQWPGLANEVMSLKFSPDSKRLLYTYGSNTTPPIGAAILDMTTGKQVVEYKEHDNSPICCTFTTDGKLAITGDSISRIRVWNAQTGATVHQLDGRGQTMFAAGWSPDGLGIAWGTRASGKTHATGRTPLDRSFRFRNLGFGPTPNQQFVRGQHQADGWQLGVNVAETPVNLRRVLFAKNDALVNSYTLEQPYDQARSYALLPDERAAIGTNDGAYVVDMRTGRKIYHLTDRGEEVWDVAPSPNGKYLLTAGGDQILRVWRLDTGALLVALFVAQEEWIAWTPEGYYAASFAGESLMGWHLNRGPATMSDFYPAAHFHKSLYRPDVIRNLLEAGDLARSLELADQQRAERTRILKISDVLPAEVKIVEPGQTVVKLSEPKLVVRAKVETKTDTRATAMRLLIDGRPYGAPRPVAGAEQTWDVELPPGQHTLVVKAENDNSFALSSPVEVTRSLGAQEAQPKLYVLAAGAAADVAGLAALSGANASQTESAGGIVVKTLKDGEATPEAIAAALEEIRSQATLADATLVFLAGEESLSDAGRYQIVAGQNRGAGIPETELRRLLAPIRGKIVLATDLDRAKTATQSGAAQSSAQPDDIEPAVRLSTAADDFFRELLTEEYGVVVIRIRNQAPSGGTRAAANRPLGQALAEALTGKADEDADGGADLAELARYLVPRIRELSAGSQTPLIERPHGVQSFPLTQPKAPPKARQ
jgi:WD40 repeat protein